MAKITNKSKWQPLISGDSVDVIAPGFPATVEDLHGAVEFLKKIGLNPNVPNDLFGEDLLCSNSKDLRLKHLKNALANKKSKAIWCLRGGYGSIQLMPEISKWKKPNLIKPFIGYSDIATLFTHWNQNWKLSTLHGPLLDRLGKNDLPYEQVDQLLNVLFGRIETVKFENLIPLNVAARKKTKIEAQVAGGNMTVIASAIGTPYALKTKDKIIFFEDAGERGYRIDRMLHQMHQSGFFKNVKAILLGTFTGGDDKDGQNRILPVWQEFAMKVKFPVIYGVPAGHGSEQWVVPLGTKAKLQTGSECAIEIQTGADL